jgi:hypothetical protein
MSDQDDSDFAEQAEREPDLLIGTIEKWTPPKGAGPAKFDLRVDETEVIKCQVWPREYNSTEENPIYGDCKNAAMDGFTVRLEGRGEWQTFVAKKGPRAGRETKSYQFTVWSVGAEGLDETSTPDLGKAGTDTDAPVPINQPLSKAKETVERILKERQSNRRSSGNPTRSTSGGNGGTYRGLSQEEWDRKSLEKRTQITGGQAVNLAAELLLKRDGKLEAAALLESAVVIGEVILEVQAKLLESVSGSTTSGG